MNRRRIRVHIFRRWMREDSQRAYQRFLIHTIGASWWLPRVLRHAAYRAAGMRSKGPNIFPDLTVVGPASNITIGRGSLLNAQCYIDAAGEVRIGERVMVGPRVMFLTSDHPAGGDGRPQSEPVSHPITVGDGAWIGAGVLLCPGVTVGDDVVVAAGAVVVHDCAPRGVYAGVPARRVKDLTIATEVAG